MPRTASSTTSKTTAASTAKKGIISKSAVKKISTKSLAASNDAAVQMDEFKREMLQAFGEAYQGFGLNKQMGYIVALMLYSPQALSLDDITEQLGVSKGPVSQMTRRLSERNIIRKIWSPGTRKDYYELQPEVFANAFRNFTQLIHHNTAIAQDLQNKLSNTASHPEPEAMHKRLQEMQVFYALMEKHFANFLTEWAGERASMYAASESK